MILVMTAVNNDITRKIKIKSLNLISITEFYVHCKSIAWNDCFEKNVYFFSILFLFSSFSKMLLQKEELEQKHLHLVQIVESEKTAKWQYTQQCEELTMEIKKLRAEVNQNNKIRFFLVIILFD